MPRSMLLLALLASGCTGAPPEPRVAPTPETRAFAPVIPEGATGILRGVLVSASAVEVATGWQVTAELKLHHARPLTFDGERTWGRAVLVPQDSLVLVGGGQRIAARPVDVGPNLPPGVLHVPFEPPRSTSVTLTFDVPGDLPDDLALRFGDESGVAELWLAGRPRTPDGAPAVAITPMAPSGRPAEGEAAVVLPVDDVLRADGSLPLYVPAGATEGTLELPGHAPVPVRWSADDLSVQVPVSPVGQEREAAFAAAWPDLPDDPASRDLDALAVRLGDREAVVDWVREHLAVLATSGIQRSPSATLRLGAGSPLERAVLARELLARRDVRTVVLCGDLPPAEAAALYQTSVPLPELPEVLATLVEGARSRVASLAADVAEGLPPEQERPLGARGRLLLIPEWCWLEQPGGADDGGPLALDLRPAPFNDAPLPFPWRSTEHPTDDLWRVDVRFSAIVDGQDVVLAQYGSSASALSDVAFVFDLQPSGQPGGLRPRLLVVDDVEAGGRAGPDLPAGELQGVQLDVFWRDPRDLSSRRQKIELWQDVGAEPLEAMRVLVSTDPTVRSPELLGHHLRQAVDGGHALPGAEALRARHDLYSLLRAHLGGGEVPAEPSLLVTTAGLDDQGIAWRFEVMSPGVPVRLGRAADREEVARAAAADAVARAVVLGVQDPAPPSVWLRSSADLPRLPRVPQAVQMAVARTLDQVWYGAAEVDRGEESTVWALDPATGGVAWFGGVPQVVGHDPGMRRDVDVGSARWPVERWDLVTRCVEAVRWSTLTGAAVPHGCAPQVATLP